MNIPTDIEHFIIFPYLINVDIACYKCVNKRASILKYYWSKSELIRISKYKSNPLLVINALCNTIDITIYKNITTITFTNDFNQPFTPNFGLTHLEFGSGFNQPFTPNLGLTHLKFGWDFNQEFTPNFGLLEVKFSSYFNQLIIPNDKLKKITFGALFDKRLEPIKKGLTIEYC